MNHSHFFDYVIKVAQADSDECTEFALRAYEDATSHEQYRDAALIVMLACRQLGTHEACSGLVSRLSETRSWKSVLRVRFFNAWLVESEIQAVAQQPRMRFDESEPRSIETGPKDDEELLKACMTVFSDLESRLSQSDRQEFGGMNLLFFLNRSRRSRGSSRIHNAASFGLRYISPESEEEQDSLLGRAQRAKIRIRSVYLGTEPSSDFEE